MKIIVPIFGASFIRMFITTKIAIERMIGIKLLCPCKKKKIYLWQKIAKKKKKRSTKLFYFLLHFFVRYLWQDLYDQPQKHFSKHHEYFLILAIILQYRCCWYYFAGYHLQHVVYHSHKWNKVLAKTSFFSLENPSLSKFLSTFYHLFKSLKQFLFESDLKNRDLHRSHFYIGCIFVLQQTIFKYIGQVCIL